MNYLKKFIVLLVTSSIILLNTVSVNADSWRFPTPQEELQNYRDLYNEVVTEGGYQSWLKRLSKKVFDNVGFMIDESGILIQKIKDAIHGSDPNMPSDMTDEEAYDWVKSNLTVSDNIIANDSFNTYIKNYESNFVDEYKYTQGFTVDLKGWDFTQAPDLISTIEDNQDTYWIIYFRSTSLSASRLLCIPKSEDSFFVFVSDASGSNDKAGNCYITNMYGTYADPRTLFNNCIVYDGNGNQITPTQDNYQTQALKYLKTKQANSNDFSMGYTTFWLVSYDKSFPINVYSNKNILVDITTGVAPYYYNNDVWQNFSNTTGDYTFTPTNINTITYGDTVSYINDYHDTNNNYPDNSTINNWINNTNEENITNNNGGGSGGDDSGGGSGSDSPSDIFGWLKQLGAVIGSLIKGVGEFLTEIVTGLVSAINSLLSGISDLIQNITESLPTVFMDFLGTLFSWLPDEWVALFSACIIFMLLWGIIKTIRGS